MANNFSARRQAAIQAELEGRLEWEARDEFEHELCRPRDEFAAQMERDRATRQKYWEAMITKRDHPSARPARSK